MLDSLKSRLRSLLQSRRPAPQPEIPAYVFSLHKSGSHLLANILRELGLNSYPCYGEPHLAASLQAPPGFYISTIHRIPSEDVRNACAEGKARIILNIRDPRDIFLSTIDYFDWSRPPTAFAHVNFYRQAYAHAFKSRAELAEAVLHDFTLGDYPYTISSQLNSCLVLHHHPSVLSVSYEEFHRFASPYPFRGRGSVSRTCQPDCSSASEQRRSIR